jgi:RNA polymerase sigma factor (sigma-70 family)
MAHVQLNGALRRLLSGALAGHEGGDGQLLERFLARRDSAAFETLLRRHGPMVLGVCQRVLRNIHDAEDAFQATFLVLVRKAASVRPREHVGNWLYGVAYRTAMKAKAMAAKRSARERMNPRPELIVDASSAEWLAMLDQELSQLPDKYRVPVVLCDLEGKAQKEAAQLLGWPEGTLCTRLRRARALLGQRLARRGLALLGGVAALLAPNAVSAIVPPPLATATMQAATYFAAGQSAVACPATAKVVALTEGVLQTMFLSKMKTVLALGVLLVLIGLGLGAYQGYSVPANAGGGAQPPENKNKVHLIVTTSSKIAHGRTAPGEGWQRYGTTDEEAALGIYIDVDTSEAKFKSVPTYITSLGGDNGHWAVTGASAIYPRVDKDGKQLPLESGFRIYLHFPSDPDFPAAAQEAKKKWYVNWVAYGE